MRGTTTREIFAQIDASGLVERSGERAVGLTSAEWILVWQGLDTLGPLCSPPPMTITLNLIVTLPRHGAPNELPEGLRTRWQDFEGKVAAHEQRHVDIFLEGAQAMKAGMEAALARRGACAEIEKGVRALWESRQAEIGRAQEQFHVEDKAQIAADRKPLQTQIDANQARLATMDAEIKRAEATRDGLRRDADAMRARLDAARASPAAYNTLAARYNALVDELTRAGQHRNRLVTEYNALVGATNGLIEALNWTR